MIDFLGVVLLCIAATYMACDHQIVEIDDHNKRTNANEDRQFFISLKRFSSVIFIWMTLILIV